MLSEESDQTPLCKICDDQREQWNENICDKKVVEPLENQKALPKAVLW